MDKLKIKISDIFAHQNWRQNILSKDFDELEFIDNNGEPIICSELIKNEWKYSGLNNIDFITSGFYELTDGDFDNENQ